MELSYYTILGEARVMGTVSGLVLKGKERDDTGKALVVVWWRGGGHVKRAGDFS